MALSDNKFTLEGLKIAIENWKALEQQEYKIGPVMWLMHPRRYDIYKANLERGMSQLDALVDAELRELES